MQDGMVLCLLAIYPIEIHENLDEMSIRGAFLPLSMAVHAFVTTHHDCSYSNEGREVRRAQNQPKYQSIQHRSST
jgi:hypothetical protein